MEITVLHPYLFQEYLTANATIPQVSDGIKWWLHHAYLQNPVVDLGTFAKSQFGKDQLAALSRITNAIHNANNVPFAVPNENSDLANKTPIVEGDFQILMTKVKHSIVNNLCNFQSQDPTFENDLAHDTPPPSEEMIIRAAQVAEEPTYKTYLEIVMGCVHSKEGKDLLKAYRGEFRKGKRTSAVWRLEGYGNRFAFLVRDAFGTKDIDVGNPLIKSFLRLNNLSRYAAFEEGS